MFFYSDNAQYIAESIGDDLTLNYIDINEKTMYMYCSQKTYVILIPVILFTAANDLILDMEIDNDNSINVKE